MEAGEHIELGAAEGFRFGTEGAIKAIGTQNLVARRTCALYVFVIH
jgi:hypothetical protein